MKKEAHMGYSCTVDASNMLGVINKMCGLKDGWLHINGKKFFFERGRENADGAVTGTLMMDLGNDYCRKAGNVRINADGTIARFPGLTAKDKDEAHRLLRTTSHDLLRTWSYGAL
jgi:hypothetical protein